MEALREPMEPSLLWHWSALAANIVVGLAIPIAGFFVSEFVLRRYSPRRKVE